MLKIPVFIKADISVPLLASFLFLLQFQQGEWRGAVISMCLGVAFHSSMGAKKISGTELLEVKLLFSSFIICWLQHAEIQLSWKYIYIFIYNVSSCTKIFPVLIYQKNYAYMCNAEHRGSPTGYHNVTLLLGEELPGFSLLYDSLSILFSIAHVVYCI